MTTPWLGKYPSRSDMLPKLSSTELSSLTRVTRRSGSRRFGPAVLWAAGLVAGCNPSSPTEQAARTESEQTAGRASKAPNVLLVVYDARRRDDFSFGPFGNQRNDTPFLARFVRNAAYFREAISPGCWTVPVHASMFSGLSVGELGIDYYSKGFGSFSTEFRSLAEILRSSGYRTISYADHPYFYHRDRETSLMRGFERFSVVRDFEEFACYSNVGTADGEVRLHSPLAGLVSSPSSQEELIRRFDQGELRLDLGLQADLDPASGVYFGRLDDLFDDSDYFDKRYGEEFDRYVFPAGETDPFFLFVNLHMCTIAYPDPGLWERWLVRTLMANAQARGKGLTRPEPSWDVEEWARQNLRELDVSFSPWTNAASPASAVRAFKHVFDNRFYDACFRSIWEYLDERGLTDDTVTLVCSDHGLSFGEQGEKLYFHAGARPTESLVRVPLILRLPASWDMNRLHREYDGKVSLTDLFPTIVDLALGPGVFERELPVRGMSLLKRIATDAFEEVVYAESMLKPNSYEALPGVAGPGRAIYRGNAKLVFAPALYSVPGDYPHDRPLPEDMRIDDPLLLLYDLSDDPHELRDLAASKSALASELVGRWERVERHEVEQAPTPQWDEEALETLRALGYVE